MSLGVGLWMEGDRSTAGGVRIEAEDVGSGMALRGQEQWKLIKRTSANSQKTEATKISTDR